MPIRQWVRWMVIGATLGVVVGVVVYALGVRWSADRGDAEPLELLALLLTSVTLPFSVLVQWAGSEAGIGWTHWSLWAAPAALQGGAIGGIAGAIAARRARPGSRG